MTRNSVFLDALRSELLKRTKKNPRFSIRAFASQLGIQPPALAQILNGSRPLTDKMCLRLGEKLRFSPAKMNRLMLRPMKSAEVMPEYRRLKEDAFRTIADWENFAILELIKTKSFRGDLKWIARKLGLSLIQVTTAVERLKRLNYLQAPKGGTWVDQMGPAVNLGNLVPAPAYTVHQKQLLAKASDALDTVAYERRVQSSMMFAGSSAKVAEAKRRILSFIEEIDEFLSSDTQLDEVFSLSVSLFPVTTPTTEKKLTPSPAKMESTV